MMKTIKLSFIFILLIFAFFLLVNWKKVIGWSEKKISLQKKIELVELKEENIDLKEEDSNNEPEIPDRKQLRKEILEAVNAGDFNNIQQRAGWKSEYLTFEERNAIEALFYGIKIGNKIVIYRENHAARQKKDKLLEEKGNFSSIEEIVDFKNVIVKVLN